MAIKFAHQPLLPPGRHVMTMADLHNLTVSKFPGSTRRPALFKELNRLEADLREAAVICELWINGSFLTEKPEPDDIDLSFACFAVDFDKLEKPLRDVIWLNLNGGKQYSPYLDTYLCFRFLKDDTRALADGSKDWSEKWGKGWDDWLKGFVVLKIGGTNVGFKLPT